MGEAILIGNTVTQKAITDSIIETAMQTYVNNTFDYFTDESLVFDSYKNYYEGYTEDELYTTWVPLLNDGIRRVKYIVNPDYDNYVKSPIYMYDKANTFLDVTNFGPVTLGPNTGPMRILANSYTYNTNNHSTANNGGLYVKTVDGILMCALMMFKQNNGSTISMTSPAKICVEGSLSI